MGSDEPVVGNSEVRQLEERVRELERLLGRKTHGGRDPAGGSGQSESKKPILRPLSLPKDGSR